MSNNKDQSVGHGSPALPQEIMEYGANTVWLSPDTLQVHAPLAPTLDSSPPLLLATDGSPLPRSARAFLESVITRFVVVISASVRIEYRGRASSVADVSPRIIITKPDGTLIIHEDTKQRPLNWQPPGTKFCISTRAGSSLVLEAFRRKHNEAVILWFEKLYYIAASRVAQGEFRFSGSEAEMVDLIFRNPEMIEPGFNPETREVRTRHGTVDLIGRDRVGNMLVLEFKRRQAQLSSASQLDRYVRYFSEMQHRRKRWTSIPRGVTRRRNGMNNKKIRGGIVAPSITLEARALVRKMGYEFFKVEPRIDIISSAADAAQGSPSSSEKMSDLDLS